MKKLAVPVLVSMLAIGVVSCGDDDIQEEEASREIERSQESGEDVDVDRDVLGDDEVEID